MGEEAAHHDPWGGVTVLPHFSTNSRVQVWMGLRAEKRRQMLRVNICRGFSSGFPYHDEHGSRSCILCRVFFCERSHPSVKGSSCSGIMPSASNHSPCAFPTARTAISVRRTCPVMSSNGVVLSVFTAHQIQRLLIVHTCDYQRSLSCPTLSFVEDRSKRPHELEFHELHRTIAPC